MSHRVWATGGSAKIHSALLNSQLINYTQLPGILLRDFSFFRREITLILISLCLSDFKMKRQHRGASHFRAGVHLLRATPWRTRGLRTYHVTEWGGIFQIFFYFFFSHLFFKIYFSLIEHLTKHSLSVKITNTQTANVQKTLRNIQKQ